jgi:Tfp pilus assembly protein PilF
MTMKRPVVALNAAIGAVLLFGCTSPPAIPGMEVMPVMSVRHGGEQAAGYWELGRFYEAQDRPELAVDAYRKALALDATQVEAHSALGMIYASQQRLELARIEFAAAVALAPRSARLHNNLGYVLYLQGNPKAAIVAFERAAALDRDNPRTWNNLGLALAQAGDTGASRDAFARASTMGVTPAPVAQASAADALALAKDRGVIRPVVADAAANAAAAARLESGKEATPASTAFAPAPAATVAMTAVEHAPLPQTMETAAESRLVALSPNVYELKWPQASVAPVAVLPTPAAQAYRLEVANGNGINGMARRVGQMLAAIGWPTVRLTNQKPFVEQVTQIQYREGYATSAMALRKVVPGMPNAAPSAALRADTDVRLVLGRDLPANVAFTTPKDAADRIVAVLEPAPPTGN